MARQGIQVVACVGLVRGMACAPAGAQTPRRVTIILGSQQVEVTHPGLDLAAKLAGMAIYD